MFKANRNESVVSKYASCIGLFVALAVSSVSAEPAFGPQSSTLNTEWDFDFVETFDGLSNWVRKEGSVGNIHDTNKMPKLADGSASAWGYYSEWTDRVPSEDWIGAYGDERVWRGTKSATIDIGGEHGPSRFGLFMGEGYREFYLFYMVNIPKNEFPTNCNGVSNCSGEEGTYTEGESYTWFSSWKAITFNIGCLSAQCPDRNTYSDDWNFTNHIKLYNYGADPGLTLKLEPGGSAGSNIWASDGGVNLEGYLGGWFGFEYHITQTDTTTTYDVWVYDQAGNAVKIMDNQVWASPAAVAGKRWDQMFFGGNNSGTYKWGDSMQSEYQIDDVIIDDKRIGPKYFSLIAGSLPSSPPLFPSDVSVSVKE